MLLDAVTAPDFTLVGPPGFVPNKQQWLDRYRTGALAVRDGGDRWLLAGLHLSPLGGPPRT